MQAHVEVERRAVDDRHDRARLRQRLREGVALVLEREGPLELLDERRPVLAQKEAGDVARLVEPAFVEPHPVRVDGPDDREAEAQPFGEVGLGEQRQKIVEDERADLLFRVRDADERGVQRPVADLEAAELVPAA